MHINESPTGITDSLHIDGMPWVSVAEDVCNAAGWLKSHMGTINCIQHMWEAGNEIEIHSCPLSPVQCMGHLYVKVGS